ncbi:hypothetical protein [Sphingosinicella sp. BN140058]|uniref:hypothetical protein n=1 Tax=Sphingosinicella sp. BN140058 TaxID=1892855 RepID=UPI0013EC3B14|nr:hypothetical protein [Sphingosinicella sp. BN140058]
MNAITLSVQAREARSAPVEARAGRLSPRATLATWMALVLAFWAPVIVVATAIYGDQLEAFAAALRAQLV